jgi:PAS domain S-box-containing protein
MKAKRKESKKTNAAKSRKGIGSKQKPRSSERIEDAQVLIHLLQVNQIELEHQNQELRIAEEELELSRNRYVNLFDFSPIPYFVLDLQGVIQEVNLSASKMLGFERKKLIGKYFVSYISFDHRDILKTFMQTVFSSPEKHSCNVNVVNNDKLVSHVRMEGRKLDGNVESDQQCHFALIDLTEHNEA